MHIYFFPLILFCISNIVAMDTSRLVDAQKYSQSNQSQHEQALKELSKLNLCGTENLLDVGSGDGSLSNLIAKKVRQLYGIDKSSEMVAFAALHNKDSNVDYCCIDAIEYNAPNTYDAVVSFWTLHWIDNYEQALNNIAISLKQNGKALLAHGVGRPLLQKIAMKLLDTNKWRNYKKDAKMLTYPSLSRVASAVEKTDLTIEHLEVKQNGTWMAKDAIIKNWRSLDMFNFIPTEQQEEYCNEILKEFESSYPPNRNGELFRHSTVVVMVLKK